jgi:hypothetical protein
MYFPMNTTPTPEELYQELTTKVNTSDNFSNLGEDMQEYNVRIGRYLKPCYLIDNRAQRAYEFMDGWGILQRITQDDIDWESLRDQPEQALERARALNAFYPTLIYRFEGGVAYVTWDLIPDGRYFEDDDGYGMSDDSEVALCGCIDRTGRAVGKFRLRTDFSGERLVREEALRLLKAREEGE